jgi:hypothetical protein
VFAVADCPDLCVADRTACRDSFVTIGKATSIGDATAVAPGWQGFEPDRLLGCGAGW